jgi:hypothetical protein
MTRVVVCLLTALAVSPITATAVNAQDQLPTPTHGSSDGLDLRGAFSDSIKLLLIEHAWRIGAQEKTRRELGGPFWSDYARSVRMPRQWEDTDAWWVNYIGHPIHGSAAGYIWLDHHDTAPKEFTNDRKYWLSRVGAFTWVTAYSVQFEVGPLSEASIGNVGLRSETVGWVDHIVTPIGAVGFMVAEDALDRFVVKWAEERIRNPLLRAPIRLAANPGRALSNAASGRAPWYRSGRPLNWR